MGGGARRVSWGFFFSSRRRHPRCSRDWSSDVCSSDLVGVPVIAAGRINDPALAERVLRDGQADLCVMTRALIADPDLPQKTREGRLDDIRLCHGYNSGCIDRIYTGRGVTCVQNAVVGREREWSELPPAERPLKGVGVGGGPAGARR